MFFTNQNVLHNILFVGYVILGILFGNLVAFPFFIGTRWFKKDCKGYARFLHKTELYQFLAYHVSFDN